jgi:NADH:ubiquinone reductase (H+-translocating)
MPRPHVVIIGAGFGGLRAARALADIDVDITVVDANNFHTFQPLLYQVATAGLDADDICFPVRAVLRRNRAARFVLGTVTAISLGDRTIAIDRDRVVSYDFLVIAAGTVSTSFGIAGVDRYTLPLKTIDDALAVRTHLLARFEAASAGPHTVDLGRSPRADRSRAPQGLPRSRPGGYTDHPR